ncbi:CDP-alcohol phosphatidyltransferase family protein [Rhabdochlamydiaceae symbiont of Dictyostelium giganteum]|uniref:CDP-alcohol phosphatidyltransferase family protein n=1 Tax=Rhabdochlamydiaceae symbiont of Dictyostelium giganteum TaxID=3342349 RepID=UPI00384B5172
MKLPLILTLFRIVLSPLFVALYLLGGERGAYPLALPYLLLLIVIVCEISDALDGFFARRNNQVTNLGKVLDPMADSFFRLSVFFAFTQGILQIPLWIVIVFFWRDSLVNTLRALFALEGIALAARVSGKIKAILQAVVMICILLGMIGYAHDAVTIETLKRVSRFLTTVAAIYTFCSGCEYLWISRVFLQSALGISQKTFPKSL